MSGIGSQGGMKTVPDDKPVVGANPGQPSRPDHLVKASVEPMAPTYIGSNDANKAK